MSGTKAAVVSHLNVFHILMILLDAVWLSICLYVHSSSVFIA